MGNFATAVVERPTCRTVDFIGGVSVTGATCRADELEFHERPDAFWTFDYETATRTS